VSTLPSVVKVKNNFSMANDHKFPPEKTVHQVAFLGEFKFSLQAASRVSKQRERSNEENGGNAELGEYLMF
jgi:hypothetical protein